MGNKIISTTEIRITIEMFEDGQAQVRMKTQGANSADLSYATKYMMWIISKNSGLDFEEALQHLCQGTRKFKGVSLSLLPKKKG